MSLSPHFDDVPSTAWRRVQRGQLCPICSHDSWCTVAPDGSAARCKRVESAKAMPGEDGPAWLHVLVERGASPPWPRRTRVRVVAAPRDFRLLAEQWQRDLSSERLAAFAESLGITADALMQIGCGWTGTTYSFPMYDAENRVVGIRLRCARTGRKFAYKASKEGVFRAASPNTGLLLLPEGASDTAAALQLGFDVVGRPSCSGGTRIVAKLVVGRDVAIVSDRDNPGIRGGESLACAIAPYVTSLRVVVPPPPHNDLRDWVRAGATPEAVRAYIDVHLPRRLTTHVKVKP